LASHFSDLISLGEITYQGLNWVNIMQGKNEVVEFLSGKVFFISLEQITFMFLECFLGMLKGKHKIGLQLPYFFIFYWGFISNHIYGWNYMVTRELGS